MPSASATAAPRIQPIIDCGPPNVATRAGIVINGPIPTIIDIFRLTAWSKRRRRSNIADLVGGRRQKVRTNYLTPEVAWQLPSPSGAIPKRGDRKCDVG